MTVWLDRTITAGILFLILYTPLAYGAVSPWAFSKMEAVIFGLVAVWMVKRAMLPRQQGAEKIRNSKSEIRNWAIPVTLFLVLVLFQLIPLPPEVLRSISSQTFETYRQILPGWPERVPYAELPQSAKGEEQGAGSTERTQVSMVGEEQRAESKEQGAGSTERRVDGGQTTEVGHRSLVSGQVSMVGEEQRAESKEQGAGSTEQRTEGGEGEPGTQGTTQDAGVETQNSARAQSAIRNPKLSCPYPLALCQIQLSALSSMLPETWLPLSVNPELTRIDLLKFASYAALFFLIWLYPFGDQRPEVRSRRSEPDTRNPTPESPSVFSSMLRAPGSLLHAPSRLAPHASALLFTVLLAGLLVAVLGFVETFSSAGASRAAGPFVNPNHFANYLSLVFPLTLAGALFRTSITSRRFEIAFRIFCALTAFLLFTGILLSLSRSAWVSALLSVVVLLWLSPGIGKGQRAASRKQGANHVHRVGSSTAWMRHAANAINAINAKSSVAAIVRSAFIIACLLLVASLLFVGPTGRERVDARLGDTVEQDLGLWGRTILWKDSLLMIRDFPILGVGLGSWQEMFLRYQRPPWDPFYREAHNDYVEVLAETGVVGFSFLAWFFISGGRRILQGLKKASSDNRPIIAAMLAALGAMAFHEIFDFNLQIPANAFLFTVLFALALRVARGQRSEVGDQLAVTDVRSEGLGGRGSERFASSRFGTRAWPFALCALSLLLLAVALHQNPVSYYHRLETPQSVAEARELIFSHPTESSYHLSLLRLLGDQAPLSLQLDVSRVALSIAPTNPNVRDFYASTLLTLGKMDEGREEITRSVMNAPSLERHYYLEEKILAQFSDEEQKAAEDGFKRALARDYPGALQGLAGYYARLDRHADQAALYEQAAQNESDKAKKTELLMNAGLAYLRAEREQGAAVTGHRSAVSDQKSEVGERVNAHNALNADRLFRAAIAVNPSDPRAYRQLATAIYGPNHDLAAIKEIIAEGGKNGVAAFPLYLALAEAAQQAGSPEESRAALDSANKEIDESLRSGLDPYPLYMDLAESARKAGDRERELAALLAALEIQPGSTRTLARLAGTYREQRNYDRAVLYLNKIAGTNPDSAQAYFQLAAAEEALYHFAAAGRAYARAVALAPQNAGYRQRYEAFKARVDRNRVTGDGRRGKN